MSHFSERQTADVFPMLMDFNLLDASCQIYMMNMLESPVVVVIRTSTLQHAARLLGDELRGCSRHPALVRCGLLRSPLMVSPECAPPRRSPPPAFCGRTSKELNRPGCHHGPSVGHSPGRCPTDQGALSLTASPSVGPLHPSKGPRRQRPWHPRQSELIRRQLQGSVPDVCLLTRACRTWPGSRRVWRDEASKCGCSILGR